MQKPRGSDGIQELTKALVERCLNAGIEHQLSETKANPESAKNRRNGYSSKTVKGTFGEAEIAIPCDLISIVTLGKLDKLIGLSI